MPALKPHRSRRKVQAQRKTACRFAKGGLRKRKPLIFLPSCASLRMSRESSFAGFVALCDIADVAGEHVCGVWGRV